jgi:hypothetical protein
LKKVLNLQSSKPKIPNKKKCKIKSKIKKITNKKSNLQNLPQIGKSFSKTTKLPATLLKKYATPHLNLIIKKMPKSK